MSRRKFIDEMKEQYPDWFSDESKPTSPPVVHKQVVKKVKIKTPSYIFPILLALGLMCVYTSIIHVKTKCQYWNNDDAVAHLEQQLVKLEQETAHAYHIALLVANLHNENFYILHRLTGTKDLIFINQDFTIDRMPRHMRMTKEGYRKIKEKYLKQDQFQPYEIYLNSLGTR